MKTLSGAWGRTHHRALGRTTDKAKRLAIALGAVRSVIRVVDRTQHRLDVDWAAVDATGQSMSFTDLATNAMRLNPKPILDEGLGHGAALDVCVGFALHEASHSQESRDRHKFLIKREEIPAPVTVEDIVDHKRTLRDEETVFSRATGRPTREVPAFTPMRVAAYLWNLVEDVRIEQATSKNWPGFAPYFDRVLDYMWSEMRKRHETPEAYGPTLTDKLRVAYIACRYPGRIQAPFMAKAGPEVEWWQAWQADYLSDAVDTPTTIQRALDYLGEDETTAKELADEAAAEKKEREAGERLRDQIDRLIREGIKGGFEMCVVHGGEMVPLDADTAAEVRKYLREGLIEVATVVTAPGAAMAPVRVSRPEETPTSRRAYVGRPDGETEALRSALVFRPAIPQHDVKLLKSGPIDDDELYRWGMGDMRVFSERIIESKPDVFMGLLVDASGSMSGTKLEIAQRLAQLFVWAVHDQEGIATGVWAHTADSTDVSCEVFRVWEPGDPLSRLGVIADIYNANNRDGQAIEVVVTEMARAEQPEKVLVVLSDGLPSGDGYGQKPAQQHVRAVTRWAAGRGVRVLQLAIDPHGLRMDDQVAMYGAENVIGFSSYAALPKQLTAVLGRYI